MNEEIDSYGCGQFLIKHISMEPPYKTRFSDWTIPQNEDLKDKLNISGHTVHIVA